MPMSPYEILQHSKLPEWMVVAAGELFQEEVSGESDNPRIVEYHSVTTLGAQDDETPWCASFVAWCLHVGGFAGPLKGRWSARARSFEGWGQSIPPELVAPGAIVTFWRGKNPGVGTGHVGFYVGGDPRSGTIWVLGGNQGDAVSIKSYSTARITGFWWPPGDLPAPEAGALARRGGAEAPSAEVWS